MIVSLLFQNNFFTTRGWESVALLAGIHRFTYALSTMVKENANQGEALPGDEPKVSYLLFIL